MKTIKRQKLFSIEAWKNGAKVETKAGHPVRIVCTDRKADYPIIACVTDDDTEQIISYASNGRYLRGAEHNYDLVIVEEIEESKRWADDETALDVGWYIGENSRIFHGTYNLNDTCQYNTFASEKLAKAALAMARISQLMAHDERYGGVLTNKDWDYDNPCLINRNNRVSKEIIREWHCFLAFHTSAQRDLFLKENEQLVKDYLMID